MLWLDLPEAEDNMIHLVMLRENLSGFDDIGKPPISLPGEPLWKGTGVDSVFRSQAECHRNWMA